MIAILILSFLIALPFFLYVFNAGNRARSIVLFFGLLVIFIPSFFFLSKFSIIGSTKEIILIDEINSQIVGKNILDIKDLHKVKDFAEDEQLLRWYEEIIMKSIENDNLDSAELTLRFAEDDFVNTGNETLYYYLFSVLRDKRFPEFADASISLDISLLPTCDINNSIVKVFINDGPLIPLAVFQNNSSELILKITNNNSPIPGFDISSAFMNESTLRITTKVACENEDIFEAKKLYKLSKNNVNTVFKIPSNQWLKPYK